MINECQDAIVAALEQERCVGGRLADIKSVIKVSRELIQTKLYPCITVDWKGDWQAPEPPQRDPGSNRAYQEVTVTFDVALETASALPVEDAARELQALHLDYGDALPKGVWSVLARIESIELSTGAGVAVTPRLEQAGLRTGKRERAQAVALYEVECKGFVQV